jgi:Domain of unknown function (DUF4404)
LACRLFPSLLPVSWFFAFFVLKPQASRIKEKTMNDDRIRLRQLLDQLRTQLAGSTSVDAGQRARLELALSDADKALAEPTGQLAGQPSTSAPLRNRLSEAAIDFEVLHPTLAAEVSSIIDALGRMGI